MKEFRLAKKIIATLVKDRIKYPGRLVMDTFIMVSRCGILLILYWYVFKINNGAINGTKYIFIAWSAFLYFAFSTLRLRDISRLIMQDVQSGNVEILFSKPVSYFWYRVWWQIGSGLYSFLVIGLLGTIVLFLIIGFPQAISLNLFLPTFLFIFIGSVFLSLILYSIVGFMAFWIQDINPIFWIVDKTVMILGGSYLPLALFPGFMYKIALYSPFGAAQFITHTVYQSWQGEWLLAGAVQAFWILALGITSYLIFIKARQKVSINGG